MNIQGKPNRFDIVRNLKAKIDPVFQTDPSLLHRSFSRCSCKSVP